MKFKNPNKTPKKGTKLQKNLGVTDEEIKRTVAVPFIIDVDKRTKLGEEPKFTE